MLVPTSEVVNLTDTFGDNNKTEKFVQRYLRITHCDLFFADAAIFVEGTSETVFVPYFIENDYLELDCRYITILPVGGSHSHKFKPLIEKLGILTLIITDLDPIDGESKRKSVPPKRNSPQIISGNPSISGWGITEKSIESLSNLKSAQKVFSNDSVRIAFQTPVNITVNEKTDEALSATFEDSLVYENLEKLQELPSNNLIDEIKVAMKKQTVGEFCDCVYNEIRKKSNDKVSFALDLIYELDKVEVPLYIKEGLTWLQEKLQRTEVETATGGNDNV
jgi:predicted ATP-dependent endonuclease of OLD family